MNGFKTVSPPLLTSKPESYAKRGGGVSFSKSNSLKVGLLPKVFMVINEGCVGNMYIWELE